VRQYIAVTQLNLQHLDLMALVLSCVGTFCWVVCFWCMHRISSRQDSVLEELREMTKRVEKLSQREHDLSTTCIRKLTRSRNMSKMLEKLLSNEDCYGCASQNHLEVIGSGISC
jgi:hypothetical protein